MSRLSSRGLAAALLALCAVPAMPQTLPPTITRIQAMRADGTTAPVDVYNPTGVSYPIPAGVPDMTLIITGTNLLYGGSIAPAALLWNQLQIGIVPGSATATQVQMTLPASYFAAAGTVDAQFMYSFGAAPLYSNAARMTIAQPVPITISPTTLPAASYGVPYYFTPGGAGGPVASGGVAPYTYGFTASTVFPNNLVYDGALYGTPAQVGTFTLGMTATDAFGFSATQAVTLTITGTPFAIVTGSPLPAAMAGIAYSTAFTAANAFANTSIVWSVAARGTLPAGLTLSAAGVLSGAPQQAGTYSFGIQATAYQTLQAAQVAVQSASKSFTLVVAPSNLAVATSALPSGTEMQAYSAVLSATGGTPPYSWSLQSGALPAGLSLSTGGTISGTPTTAGSSAFTVKVTDAAGQTATRALGIGINRYIPPLSIDTRPPLPDAWYKEPYSYALSASGGEPPYSWSATGLPPGVSIAANGAISGSPTDIGTFNFTAVVTDSGKQQASATFPLVVKARPLTITTASPLPGAQVGGTVSITFSATGGVPPYTWAASGGAVPPGTTFRSGTLTGSPTSEGDFSFTVQVRDDRGAVTNKAFSITIAPPPLTIATSTLPQGRAGQPYSAALAATGGTQPYSWTISGLPSGLSGASGAIGGTPAQAGASSVTAVVTDAKGTQASRTLDLAVLGPALAITTASPLPGGAVGTPYSQSFTASGGTPPYRWAAVAGYAGSGLSLSSDGVLSGTPGDTGAFTVYVQVTDSENTAVSKAFALNIGLPALAIATASLPGGTVGVAYSAGVSATGASGAVQWSAGGLPAGLAMDAGGTIAGTPTAPGAATVSVQASDSAGRTATKVLTLAVALPSLPAPGFRGVPDTSDPAKQPAVQLGLDGTYPVPITGRITLAFAADSGGDDPTVQFSNGSRTVDFTIPAGANLATFAVPNLAFQTGTVAGTITLQATLAAAGQDITPSPAPVRTVRINRAPPLITRVTVARTATGFDVNVTGYSTTREVSQAIFRFTAAPGGSLQTTDTTLTVDAAFTKWYQDGASRPFGSQFLFTQSFSVQGSAGSIASMSVALANSVGRSDAVTANMP